MTPVPHKLLRANGIMEIVPNKPICILLISVSSQQLHVAKHMIIWKLSNNLTTTIDLNQLPPTPTEDRTVGKIVCIVQSNNESMSSPKEAKIQALDDYRNNISMPSEYLTYRNDFIRIFEPFESMWYEHLGHIETATYIVELDPQATRTIHSGRTGRNRKQEILRKRN